MNRHAFRILRFHEFFVHSTDAAVFEHPLRFISPASLLIAFSCLSLTGNFAPAEEPPIGSFAGGPVVAVFDIERTRTNDVLTLDTGEKLTGKLLNPSITLHAAYGLIKLANRWLAGIESETASGPVSVVTVNNDRLTGFLQDPTLRFEDSLGSKTIDIDPQKLRRLVFAMRPEESTGSSMSSTPMQEEMAWIPPGEFVMGSSTEEIGRDIDEGPQTKVVIPQGFWMAKREVTQAEYRAVAGVNPSVNAGDLRLPVDKVSWFEAMDYCAKLTQQKKAAGKLPKGYLYRLPTEAEWEYACRAGTPTRFSYGDDKTESHLGDYGWFARNGDSTSHPGGSRRPNPWGLFDMHGNVWEWCLDRWAGGLPGGTITNNAVAAEGTLRVARGGSWLYEGKACRSANRDDYSPANRCGDVGFRVVLAPGQL